MNHHTFRSRLAGTTFLFLCTVPVAAQGLMPTQGQIVAKIGDAPIGLPAGVTIGTTSPFNSPVISRDGAIIFRAALAGAGVTTLNDRALCIGHTKDDLAVIARCDTPGLIPLLPNSRPVAVSTSTGLPTGSGSVFSFQRISPVGGIVMFHAQMYDGGNPGLDGLVHTAAAGVINDNFMMWGPPSNLQVLAQQNVTTMPGGAKLTFGAIAMTPSATSLNSLGTAVFKSDLTGGDVFGAGNNGAWIIGIPGSLGYFTRKGDLLLGGTVGINGLGALCVLNEQGDVFHDYFLSTSLGSAPATTANDRILMITPASSGVHTTLAREGDTAPDATGAPMAGVFYGGTMNPGHGFGPAATASFQTIMTGAVTTATDGAVFTGGLGNLKLTAREGDVVPGTGGALIDVINVQLVYSENHGVVFGCSLVGGGVTPQTDSALVIAKAGVGVTVIARENDPIPGLPGWFFGKPDGSTNFGLNGSPRINDRGQILFQMQAHNGVMPLTNGATCSWDPLHGVQLQVFGDSVNGEVWGGNIIGTPLMAAQWSSNDGNAVCFTENGDFVLMPSVPGGAYLARGHVGSLNGTPSAVPVAGGVPHVMTLDVTPTYGNNFYFILATGLGTDAGFPHPLNFGITVPIDFDPTWTTVSQAFVNTALWTNTLFVTDATGKPLGNPPISFNMPPGYPGFLGLTLKHSALLFDGALVGTFATEPTTCYLY